MKGEKKEKWSEERREEEDMKQRIYIIWKNQRGSAQRPETSEKEEREREREPEAEHEQEQKKEMGQEGGSLMEDGRRTEDRGRRKKIKQKIGKQ